MQGSKFSKAPADTFRKLVLGAGMFVKSFVPATGVAGSPLFATDGGANFQATPNYLDLADGIDNIPPNTKELKELDYWSVQITGTGRTIDPEVVKSLLGAADIDGTDNTKITPRNYLKDSDFDDDFWWIGPVGKTDNGADATYLAIHIMNSLSTGGMQTQSANRNKAGFPFTYMAHYSLEDTDVVPFEVYAKVP